jgi:hypothetical protein
MYKKCKCYFALSPDPKLHEDGIFVKNGNTVFASTGYTGFKFMPQLGAIVQKTLEGPEGPMRVRL